MSTWKTFKELEMERVRTFNVINRRFVSVMNIDKIHPLKQEKVYNLVNNLQDNIIRKIWIFGSSTNNSCNIRSDTDVLVELKDESEINHEDAICSIHKEFAKTLGTNFDLVLTTELDKSKQFYGNLMKTRRLVYECND
ncbi:MAG: nucleotidyltransferase domain-containing protein [Lachnospiraceae bacterium]|nr:nucleotidyltransferase domain-containing protein [Lachnospiraceae bacterium]